MKKFLVLFYTLFLAALCKAQGDTTVNGDLMESAHKIYVVMAVLAIILTIIFSFLLFIERRLKQLENKQASLR